jgi:N,N'-diacetylchitobiose transport system substrate-binding protein
MKRKLIALTSAAAVVALMASACSSSKSSASGAANTGTTSAPSSNALGTGGTGSTGSSITTDGQGKTLNVWLMQDAQKGWNDVVDQAVQRFKTETGADVKINWQTWTNYGQTVDAAIGSSSAPDVIELGNTQTAKYIGANQLLDLTGDKSKFDNSGAWLDSLAASGASPDGSKQYAIPYYAGSRVLIYRKDLWDAAGVTTAPTTLDELKADLDKVKAANSSKVNFSALYLPGQNWYTAVSFGANTYGVSGLIAKANGGNWSGTLTDPKFLQGIQTWNDLQKNYSVGGATKDEKDQDALMAHGNISAIIGNGWEAGSVADPGVPRRFEPGGAGQGRQRQARRGVDPHLHRHRQHEVAGGQGDPEQQDPDRGVHRRRPGQQGHRRRGQGRHLVHPELAELGPGRRDPAEDRLRPDRLRPGRGHGAQGSAGQHSEGPQQLIRL